MTNFLSWATQNPGLAIVIIIAAAIVLTTFIQSIYLIVKHLIRMVNISTRGWPPYYLDADGDFRPEFPNDE